MSSFRPTHMGSPRCSYGRLQFAVSFIKVLLSSEHHTTDYGPWKITRVMGTQASLSFTMRKTKTLSIWAVKEQAKPKSRVYNPKMGSLPLNSQSDLECHHSALLSNQLYCMLDALSWGSVTKHLFAPDGAPWQIKEILPPKSNLVNQ